MAKTYYCDFRVFPKPFESIRVNVRIHDASNILPQMKKHSEEEDTSWMFQESIGVRGFFEFYFGLSPEWKLIYEREVLLSVDWQGSTTFLTLKEGPRYMSKPVHTDWDKMRFEVMESLARFLGMIEN